MKSSYQIMLNSILRRSAALAWGRRWWGMLSVAVQDAVAATLVEGRDALMASPLGHCTPPLADVLEGAPAVAPSLLPLRG